MKLGSVLRSQKCFRDNVFSVRKSDCKNSKIVSQNLYPCRISLKMFKLIICISINSSLEEILNHGSVRKHENNGISCIDVNNKLISHHPVRKRAQ